MERNEFDFKTSFLQIHDQNESRKMFHRDARFFLRKRYWVSFMVLLGWAMLFLLRINLSIGIVRMTSNQTVTRGNETYAEEAEFHWTMFEKGIILGSFSWGYLASPLGAMVATKFGGVRIFGVGIAATGLLTIASPILIRCHLYVYIAARILEGIFESFAAASVGEVFVRWVPPAEISRLTVISNLGAVVGSTISLPLCGFIAYVSSWEAVFYASGGLAIGWYLFWSVFIGSTPQKDKFITEDEKNYFTRAKKNEPQLKKTYPWKHILKSKPVWAYLILRSVDTWSVSFSMYYLPTYINDVLHVNIKENGYLSSILHVIYLISLLGASVLADYLRTKKSISPTKVHNLFVFASQSVTIITFLTMGLCSNVYATLAILCFRGIFQGPIMVTSYVLPLDIASQYAAFILGSVTCLMSISYILNPMLIAFVVPNHNPAEWSRYFTLLSFGGVFSTIVYFMWGSGELQPWATVANVENDEEIAEK